MPELNDLQTVTLRGNLVGAYDPKYWVVGLADPVTQTELLTYILDNLGGGSGGGEDDITEGAGTPSGAPAAGEPVIYQDITNGNVYTWDGTQWNIMAVVASNGLTKIGNDIELGGTLEKDTTISSVDFSLIVQGNGTSVGGEALETIFRIRPAVGAIDQYALNEDTGFEANSILLPESVVLELNGDGFATQRTATNQSWQVVVSELGKVQNRLLLDQQKVEITAEELQFKMISAQQDGQVGFVLTLVDVVTGRAEWLAPTGDDDITEGSGNPSGTPAGTAPYVYQNTDNGSLWVWDQNNNIWFEVCLKKPLPIYDSIADATAAGLVKGNQFKLSQNNTEGGVAGTVIEIL